MPYQEHITAPEDLVTPYAQTRAGFLRIALEKNNAATPYVNEAKALKVAALRAGTVRRLADVTAIRGSLLTAAGLSDKALGYLTEADKQEAINNLIEHFLEPAGDAFADELVFRFLLTRGDSLGGKMRNLAGKIAEKTVVQAIAATLAIQEKPFSWLDSRTREWISGDRNDLLVVQSIRGIHWQSNASNRTLLFNLTIPLVGKNVDLCLLNASPSQINRGRKGESRHREAQYYIALGELKGGVDPAGADEHWKTARAALTRIRTGFSRENITPNIFFIGAAIERAMSVEIFSQLQRGDLSNAANMTNETQLFSLVNWLIEL